MRTILTGGALAALLATSAAAETIGVTISEFTFNFLTVMRNAMTDHVDTLEGVDIQIEDAQSDLGRQLSQIQNFVASGVDAIIVNTVDTDASVAMTQAAEAAGIPLVYVNYQPVNVDSLPDNQAFIASDERESGTLQTVEVCRQLKEQGKGDGAKILILQGGLASQAGRVRTQDIHDVIATDDCSFMEIVDQQTANWERDEAIDVMTNWLSTGASFDAVIANNDEMALGAIQALKAGGVNMDEVIVAGIDATRDALLAMAAGELDVTVFQDAVGQGAGAVDVALALARGEPVEQKVYVPFQLVTPANMQEFSDLN